MSLSEWLERQLGTHPSKQRTPMTPEERREAEARLEMPFREYIVSQACNVSVLYGVESSNHVLQALEASPGYYLQPAVEEAIRLYVAMELEENPDKRGFWNKVGTQIGQYDWLMERVKIHQIPRMGGWFYKQIKSLQPRQRRRIWQIISQALGAGYATHLLYEILCRNFAAPQVWDEEELFTAWGITLINFEPGSLSSYSQLPPELRALAPRDVIVAIESNAQVTAEDLLKQFEGLLGISVSPAEGNSTFQHVFTKYNYVGFCLRRAERGHSFSLDALEQWENAVGEPGTTDYGEYRRLLQQLGETTTKLRQVAQHWAELMAD